MVVVKDDTLKNDSINEHNFNLLITGKRDRQVNHVALKLTVTPINLTKSNLSYFYRYRIADFVPDGDC